MLSLIILLAWPLETKALSQETPTSLREATTQATSTINLLASQKNAEVTLRCQQALPEVNFSRAPGPNFDRNSCSHFNADRFCAAMTDQPFWAVSSEDQRRRQTNSTLRRRIFSHLLRYFSNTISDPEILEACCGPAEPAILCGDHCSENATCQQRLGQTQLRIIPARSLDDRTSNYHSDTHQILISESLILNSFYPEINEHFILHELGHACQYTRHHTSRPDQSTLGYYHPSLDCNDDTEAWVDMQELLPAMTRCLRAPLVQAATRWRSDNGATGCRNSWATEAFADAIFAFRHRSPRSWSWLCSSPADQLHGPANLELSCIIPRPIARGTATSASAMTLWNSYCQDDRDQQ